MSDVDALLDEAASAGVRFALSGDRVRMWAPRQPPAALLERLRAAKPAVVDALKARPLCCECGRLIIEPVRDWWGGEPVHHACGLRAWEREWQVYAPHREPAAA